jgi:hypothetical protein
LVLVGVLANAIDVIAYCHIIILKVRMFVTNSIRNKKRNHSMEEKREIRMYEREEVVDLSLSDEETTTSTNKGGGNNRRNADSNPQNNTSPGLLEADANQATVNNTTLPSTSSALTSTLTFASPSIPKARTRLEATSRIIKFADQQRELRKSESDWMEAFESLVDYKEKHNHTRVPQHYKEDRKLGRWVKRQRAYCKVKYRIDLLNDVGFDWQIRKPDAWIMMFNRLLVFREKFGTTLVPPNYEADPMLSNWVRRQRHTCKNEGWIERLNDIGFEWDVKRGFKEIEKVRWE